MLPTFSVAAAALLAVGGLFVPQVAGALDETLGLSSNNLMKNGVSFGFLPAWWVAPSKNQHVLSGSDDVYMALAHDHWHLVTGLHRGEKMSPNTATSLNALLPRPMSMIGAYAQISSKDPNMTQIEPYLEDLLRQPGDRPVFALALMPAEGLASITQDVANRVAAKMAALNAEGITVWLRYAHEMNGDWYAWGQQPQAFIASWEMMANTVHATAPDTYMLWSPNERYADPTSVYGGYTPYWPDPSTVDIVGLSFYHYGTQARLNNLPVPGEALDVMSEFDSLFGSAQSKSIVLSETGAAYTRNADTGVVAPGNATEAEIKWNWLWQLSGPETVQALPWYKALCWFEVIKDENAAGNTIVKEEDFRLITGNQTVALGSRNFLAQPSTIWNRTSVAGGVSSTGTTASTSSGVSAAGAADSSPKAKTGSADRSSAALHSAVPVLALLAGVALLVV